MNSLKPPSTLEIDLKGTPMATSLSDLPPEILSQIAIHAPTANSLRNLALTSRSLHDFVETQGWRVFTHARFPSIPVQPPWKEAAHALTTMSRNWDRRAIIARPVSPNTYIKDLPSGNVSTRWNRSQGQTMGYQPVIDSYETWPGPEWSSRREVLVWGAGAELILRLTERGDEITQAYWRASRLQRTQEYGDSPCKFRWFTYREPWHQEGKDDVVSASILRPHQRVLPQKTEDSEQILVGRASGDLSLIELSQNSRDCVIKTLETGDHHIRAADMSSATNPLAAACLGNESLSIFPINADGTRVSPSSQVLCTSPEESSIHIWSTRFLTEDRVVVGRGITHTPVYVYDVTTFGAQSEPLRAFNAGTQDGEDMVTSVYPIAAVPESVGKDTASGNVFLTGGYDGNIRLHDMRSQVDCEALIQDPTDIMPIMSLLMKGRERVIAGGNKHSLLKMFDLRMTGGRAYSYLDVPGSTPSTADSHDLLNSTNGDTNHPSSSPTGAKPFSQGFNVFASPRDSRNRKYDFSPVYSLSSPSHSSSSLYVGLENSVTHFNFTSMLDKHPDPLYRRTLSRTPNGDVHVKRTWGSGVGPGAARTLNLSMYEQTAGQMDLMIQRPVGPIRADGAQGLMEGYDERWMDVRHEESGFIRRPPRDAGETR